MPRRSTKKGFVLEDEPGLQEAFRRRFDYAGFAETTIAKCVSDARRTFDASGHIYLLDMRVPLTRRGQAQYHGGLEVREHLLELGVNPRRIFLMSAGVSTGDRDAARKYGVNPGVIISKADAHAEKVKQLFRRRFKS